MSRRALELHRDGDCDGWTCGFCAQEDERERAKAEELEAQALRDQEAHEREDGGLG